MRKMRFMHRKSRQRSSPQIHKDPDPHLRLSVFTEAEAKAWAKKHDFKSGDGTTEESFRLRQLILASFKRFVSHHHPGPTA